MNRVQRLASLPHNRDVLINTLGNYLGFAFAGFYIVFLVRVFDPVEFGILSVLLTLSYLLANILSFGMPASIYAHIPAYQDNKQGAIDFILSNFILLTTLSCISLVALYFSADWLDEAFFKTGATSRQFMLAFIGAEMYISQNFVRDVLNAAGRFMHINIAINVSNLARALAFVVCAVLGILDIDAVLAISGLLGPGVVLVYVLAHRRWVVQAVTSARPSRELVKIKFTLMYFVSTQLFQLATRADLFIIAYFLTKPEVGIYGLAQRVILAVVTSTDSITQVMSPQFARLKSKADVLKLVKHSYFYMLLPSIMFLGGIFLPNPVYTFVFGTQYNQSIHLIKSLSLAYIPFSFIAVLLLFFLYTVKKPLYIVKANMLLFVSIVSLNILLIPQLRLDAPAIVFFSSFGIVFAYLLYAFRKELARID